MKIACVTDQHFGARNDSIHFSEYFEKFYNDVFFPYLEENGITEVIDLGDTFDHRKYINFNILQRTERMWFNKLREKNIKLHCIVGNHTTYFKNTNDLNSIDLLTRNSDNVTSYAEARDITLTDGTELLFIPWINSENKEKSIETINNSKSSVAFGHLDIAGFYMNNDFKSKSGMPSELFSKFDSVYTGHFHKKSDNGTIYYLGTAYQINWSDYGENKGFHVFDTETLEMEFIPNPYTILEKIFYDDEKTNYDEFDIKPYDNKIVKLIVSNKTDFYKFDRFLNRVYNDINVIDFKIIETSIDSSVDVSDSSITGEEDTLTMISNYVSGVSQSGIDNEVLTKKMTDLYNEAVYDNI
jgi:DNA repair exonuclease SbcCD nuclease subunit